MNRYEIRVVGHVDRRRARALGCEACRQLANGESALTFPAIDQAATYGVVARLRDAGLELVAIERLPVVPGDGEDAGSAGSATRLRTDQ